MANNRQAGGCVLLVMGIIFSVVGFCIAYFAGAEQYFTCDKYYNTCKLETKKMFSDTKEKKFDIRLDEVVKAVVKSHDSDDGVTYKVYVEMEDGNKIPVENVSSSGYSSHQEKASMINNYLRSSERELEMIDKGTFIRVFGFVFFGIGVLMLLGSLGGLLKILLAAAFFIGAKR